MSDQHSAVDDDHLTGDQRTAGRQANDRRGHVVGRTNLAEQVLAFGAPLYRFIRIAIALLEPATGDESRRDGVDADMGANVRARASVRLFKAAFEAE